MVVLSAIVNLSFTVTAAATSIVDEPATVKSLFTVVAPSKLTVLPAPTVKSTVLIAEENFVLVLASRETVSYTHLTLPPNREV